MRTWQRAITLCAFGGLAACSTAIPPGMPTAMLRVTAAAPPETVVLFAPACYSDRKYVRNGMIGDPLFTETPKVPMLGSIAEANNQILERVIPADRPIAFVAQGGANSRTDPKLVVRCNLTWGFTPKAGEQYHYTHTLNDQSCVGSLTRLSLVNGKIQEAPVPLTGYPTQDAACP
jgi:hypothetical protein